MNNRVRAVVVIGAVVIAVLGLVATVRIGLAGYRQGLTEARMGEIALAVQTWETANDRRCNDIGTLYGESLSEEMFDDARLRVDRRDGPLQPSGAYRVGDFIFAPPAWAGDQERAHVLGWTDPLDGYRIMVLRDGRTRSMSPRDWEKLEASGIMGEATDSP
ncbi:MAG: hypothetical protein MK085_06800 [Phycisphaerales bacterium]|nr:hypothetical protein [Phycisphaerales bacterium]